MKLVKISLIAATIAAGATAASAANYFSINSGIDAFDTVVDLNVVRSDQAGVVQILDADGNVLGMTDVNAGANQDLRVSIKPTTDDLTLQLLHGGSVVATGEVNVDRF